MKHSMLQMFQCRLDIEEHGTLQIIIYFQEENPLYVLQKKEIHFKVLPEEEEEELPMWEEEEEEGP
jgi:hypothetical protein